MRWGEAVILLQDIMENAIVYFYTGVIGISSAEYKQSWKPKLLRYKYRQ